MKPPLGANLVIRDVDDVGRSGRSREASDCRLQPAHVVDAGARFDEIRIDWKKLASKR